MNVHLFLTIPSKKLFGPISGRISQDTTNEIFASWKEMDKGLDSQSVIAIA